MSRRIDEYLVEEGIVPTRSKARLLIKEGKILCNGVVVEKCGKLVNEGDQIICIGNSSFSSRGYFKLEKALADFGVAAENKIVADIGASTGGFTQYLLQKGAKFCYCLDVGTGQLAADLRNDPRVKNLEGVNIKYPVELPGPVDLCVVDLSFISLKLVLENIFLLLKKQGEVVALFKPQFEAGKGALGKKGVLKNEDVLERTLRDFREWCQEKGWPPRNFTTSPILGKEGNREFFFYFIRE